MSRRKRRHRHEEHSNHESWAIPYGDLVTLLLAFFVVMYAISSVNDGKYRVLSDSLVEAFQGTPRTNEPIQVGEKAAGTGASTQVSVIQQAILDSQPRNLINTPGPPGGAEDAALAIRRTGEQIELALGSLIDADLLTVKRKGAWIEVEIRTDILFGSGSAVLSQAASPVLSQVAATLKPLPNLLR
ncbi:MAG: flagellar motor protein MotD, partial [Proteobacteria bacterium]